MESVTHAVVTHPHTVLSLQTGGEDVGSNKPFVSGKGWETLN